MSSKKLIIPVSENTPNAIEISKTEEQLADLIKKSNSKAKVEKSNATGGDLDGIKKSLTAEIGKVKVK